MGVNFNDELNDAVLDAFGGTPEDPEAGLVSYLGTDIVGVPIDATELTDAAPGVMFAYWFKRSDLPAVPENGDIVTIDGTEYEVVDINTDLAGGVKVGLAKKR